MLSLHGGWRDVSLTCGGLFLRGWTSCNSASAAVVAHIVHSDVIDHGLGINVRHVHVAHGSVVEEGAATPFSALEPDTDVAEAVVYASVESDLRPPVTLIENKHIIVPAPIARGPEKTWLRRQYPRAGHPKVSISSVSPISGGPNIAIAGTKGLLVYGQRWRGDPDRDDDLCRRRDWYNQQDRCE